MTSGNFSSYPIDKIWVDRAKRQRRDLVGIEELAESIARTGLIHPPVITKDGELIAGERRWTAVKSLGWTAIPVQFAEDLSQLELHLIELEENVRRVDITWQDECRAFEEYHRLRAEQEPGWTSRDTAKALGVTDAEVSQKRAVAKELEAGNERIVKADKFSTARGIVLRDSERRKTSAIRALDPEAPKQAPVPLLNQDFESWLKDSKDEVMFNFIHCDFPYGVKADGHAQGAAKSFGGYEDTAEVYWNLINTLREAMTTCVAESAHLIFWFSLDYYTETKSALESMGWTVQPHPLVWHKSDNSGILPDPKRGPRRIYETAFFASRGDRFVVGPVSNHFSHPNTKEVHMSEKPTAMLKHFFRMVVDEYSTVLDPTCGSGNAMKAAEALGANFVLGLEKDKEFFERAKEAYHEV